MNIVATFDPSAKTNDTFNAVMPNGTGRMVIYNESNVNLVLTFQNGYTGYVPAWTIMLFCISAGSTQIAWRQLSVLNTANNPISAVIVEVYEMSEKILGTFPAALLRSANIGNTVTFVTGSAATIQNNGSAPLTNWLSIQPSDAGSPTWTGDNSGNLTVNSDNAGTLVTLLQLIAGASPSVLLAAAAVLTEVLGNLQVDGNSTTTGTSTLTGNTSVGGTLTVSGDVTLSGAGTSLTVAHNTNLQGNLTVAGTQAFNGDITMAGAGTGLAVTNNQTIGGTLITNGTTTMDVGGAHTVATDGQGRLTVAGTGTGLTVSNNALVSGNLSVTGTTSLDGGNLTTDGVGHLILKNNTTLQAKDSGGTARDILLANSSNQVTIKGITGSDTTNIQKNGGSNIAHFDGTGFSLDTGVINLIIGTLKSMTFISHTGNGTVNTNLGTTPTNVEFDPTTVSGSSQTIGGTLASSTVVTTGAGLAWGATCYLQ
jgi:fibronectin-binding autotransporter adhesin